MSEQELPLYQCYKKVRAVKIEHIYTAAGRTYIVPNIPEINDIPVSQEYVDKHQPKVGGYYVKYLDGYTSYSPAEAFENGYSKV